MRYKKVLIVLAAIGAVGCGNAARPIAENSAPIVSNSEHGQTVIAHSSENQPQPSGTKSKWTQGGQAFDTTALDTAIAAAQKKVDENASDKDAKIALSKAYLERANALTQKSQYAAALGDYRRTLKYDPTNAEAKDWVDKIIAIYDSINRESPPEGQEPPPLPFKKDKI